MIALGMAREGADVIVNYNTDYAGAASAAEKIREMGRRATVLKADIGQVSEIAAMFK